MHSTGLWVVLGLIAASAAEVERPKTVDTRLAIDLFAAEPQIVTPTGIAVDAKGRVLVIESHTHFRPEGYSGPPADRIQVFEDADGDGRADRIRTFFEGTKYTMGLAVAPDGSVFVTTRYELFRLEDADGDGRAEKQIPIAHLETAGNYPHNGLSGPAFDASGNLIFGLGENLGADYRLIGSDGTTLTGGGEGGNLYRCRPDGSGLTRIATGFWNPFHQAFDTFGRLFVVDNDPDSRPPCRLLHIVEGGDYGYRFRNGRKGLHPFTAWNGELPGTLPMVAGTGEAPSGLVVYESDNLPDDYRGDLLATSWGDHRIERFKLRPEGASFRATLQPVIEGGENFRPVGIAVAPDGSLFVSDWVDKSYNVHGKGRVWHIHRADRVAGRIQPPSSTQEALSHPDRSVRRTAARQLLEEGRGEKGREILSNMVRDGKDTRARAIALETLVASHQDLDPSVRGALQDPSSDIRALAVRILPSSLIDPERIAKEDDSAEVRAEALRRIRNEQGLPLLLGGLEDPDPFLAQSAREGLKRTSSIPRLLELAERETPSRRLGILLVLRESSDHEARSMLPAFLTDPDPKIRLAALQWVCEQRLVEFRDLLSRGLASGATTRSLFEAYLAALERLDGVDRLATQEVKGEELVAQLLVRDDTSPVVRRRALRMLRPDHPSLTVKRLKSYLAAPELETRLEAVRTLREGPHPERVGILAGLARSEDQPATIRAEAIVGLTDDSTRELLIKLAEAPESVIRHEALRSLRGLTLTGPQRDQLDNRASSDDATKALFGRLIGRNDEAAPSKNNDLDSWLKLLEGPADAAEGERIFFHPRGPGCYRCHQVDGRGGHTGPDLSTTTRELSRARLVESILQPSKEVAPQFVAWLVSKTDGTVLLGSLIEDSPLGEQTYADAEGRLVTLKRSEIEERRPQSASIMPEDLARTMTVPEFRDLLAFLRQPRSDVGTVPGPEPSKPGNAPPP
jgi:putative membrane-bound dehydrogenase-like protein